MSQRAITVAILGGWSPGPLDDLKWRFRERCTFVEPSSLPMPPVGVSWCADPFCVLLLADVVLLTWLCSWLSSSAGLSSGLILLAVCGVLVAAVVIARVCVAGLVRGAMRVGANRTLSLIRQRSVDIVVGFSWGGGVAAKLVEQGGIGTDSTPAVLLLAPTTSAISRCALLPDPASTIRIDSALRNRVHVFHASYDGFCPASQTVLWEQTGATMHLCRDSHVFEQASSLDEIACAFFLESFSGKYL